MILSLALAIATLALVIALFDLAGVIFILWILNKISKALTGPGEPEQQEPAPD